jgi:hypothetical protein
MKDEKRAADDAERERFEAAGITSRLSRCTEPGYEVEYSDPHTQFAWKGWQAALSARADGGKDSSDARDAARYRKFRLNAYWWGVGNPTPEELDARIDAAIAGEKK